MKNNFVSNYIKETKNILNKINQKDIERIIKILIEVKKTRGRIFFIGVGGSAANTSHAVNDFRKILALKLIVLLITYLKQLQIRTTKVGTQYLLTT